jgi:hypothetical protein
MYKQQASNNNNKARNIEFVQEQQNVRRKKPKLSSAARKIFKVES